MTDNTAADPLTDLDAARLRRLSRLASGLLAGRPLHPGGTLHERRATAGQDFVDHRTHVPGDDLRSIDWRASARRREPVVRRYRDERAGEWLIALDHSASMGVGTPVAPNGAWPLAVQLAAAAAFVLTEHGHRLVLALFNRQLDAATSPGRGGEAVHAVYRLLREATPEEPAEWSGGGEGSRAEACLPLARGRRVLLISDCLRPDGMIDALARLAAAGAGAELLRIAAPLPVLTGALRLVDAESGAEHTLDCDPDTNARARARLDGLFDSLTRRCRDLGIPLTTAAPGAHWDRVLMNHLLRHPHEGLRRWPGPAARGGPVRGSGA